MDPYNPTNEIQYITGPTFKFDSDKIVITLPVKRPFPTQIDDIMKERLVTVVCAVLMPELESRLRDCSLCGAKHE